MRWGHKGTRPHTQYLWVSQACWIRVEVELDAISCSRQSEPSDQQYQQHHIGEGSCEVHHLRPETKVKYASVDVHRLQSSRETESLLLLRMSPVVEFSILDTAQYSTVF